jgi:hypothetical protein
MRNPPHMASREDVLSTRLDHLVGPAPQGHGELVAEELALADAVRHRVLRDRVDGDRGQPLRHRPLRRRGDAFYPAAVRSDDRGRSRGDQDDAGLAAHLHADDRAEVGHQHGGVCLYRRGVRQLRGGAGGGSVHAGGCVRARLSAAAGDAAGRRDGDSADRRGGRREIRVAERGKGLRMAIPARRKRCR